MSKRLRASQRAANKGRNLRPRSSQLPPEPVEAEQEAAERESEAPDAPEALEASEAPVAAESADLRARETVREPNVAAAEPEREDVPASEPEAAPIALVAPVAKAEPEAAKEPEPEAAKEPEVLSTRTQPSVASPVAKVEEVKEAASTEPEVPAAPESFKVEEPKKAEPVKAAEAPKKVEEPKKAEPVKAVEAPKKAEPVKAAEAPKKVEEPKKAEPVKAAEAPKKVVEEPKKAEPKKAEPAKPVVKAEEPKKVEPKKPEPAKPVVKAEAPKKIEEPKKAANKGKGKDAEAESRRPAALRAVPDDDHDLSSISAEFFRKDEDSVPPVEELEEELGAKPVVVLSPTTLARRARLRRIVAGVVSFAGVISIAVVGKTVFASKRPPQPSSIAVIETKHEEVKAPAKLDKPAADAPKAVETAKPEPEAKKEEPAKVEEKKEEPKKEEPAKVEEKKEEAPKPTGDVAALTKEAESLLNRGKRADAMEKAREAIAADPTQAMAYLLLGSALQDSGKWKDGIEAYSECVRNATKGPVNECRAMGGHK